MPGCGARELARPRSALVPRSRARPGCAAQPGTRRVTSPDRTMILSPDKSDVRRRSRLPEGVREALPRFRGNAEHRAVAVLRRLAGEHPSGPAPRLDARPPALAPAAAPPPAPD